MTTTLVVRNVGKEIVLALKKRAAGNGRSAEAEHREILRSALLRSHQRSFSDVLGSMPNVGLDSDFEIRRELKRHVLLDTNAMNVRPIRTEKDYDDALQEIERLWNSKPGTPDGDLVEVLAVLVEAYEAKHHPIEPPDPIEAIKFQMEQMNLSRKDLEPLIGSRGRVAEVMNGTRALSLAMIRNLHNKLKNPLESLVGVAPTKKQVAAVREPSLRGGYRAARRKAR